MSSKVNHVKRLPVGTTIRLKLVENEFESEPYPVRQWIGTLQGRWEENYVKASASSKGLMGTISKLAEKWSKMCPNSRMRLKGKCDGR